MAHRTSASSSAHSTSHPGTPVNPEPHVHSGNSASSSTLPTMPPEHPSHHITVHQGHPAQHTEHQEDPAPAPDGPPTDQKSSASSDGRQSLEGLVTGIEPNAALLASPIFTITAKNGGDKQLFVHQAVLERSPVFRVACNGPFHEGDVRKIDFHEDEFDQISFLMQYLYTNCSKIPFLDCLKPHTAHVKESAEVGAQLYVLAYTYDIPGLEKALTFELLKFYDHATRHEFLFEVAGFIYHNVPSEKTEFRSQLKLQLPGILQCMADQRCPDSVVDDVVSKGGGLAADILIAMGELAEAKERYGSGEPTLRS